MASATVTGAPLLTLEEAQARLLEMAVPLPLEHVDIDSAIGRYLARPLHAHRTQPSADISAMDGYAILESDLSGSWRMIGESAAGRPFAGPVAVGEAVRISTGALLPKGTDAVVMQEDIERNGDDLTLAGTLPHPPHRHVRRRGMDFAEGEEVLPAGTRIGPAQAALAIAAGHRHLPVRSLPRIAVIDSGDELAPDPEACAQHQIPASNGTMLRAMLEGLTAEVTRLGPVADSMEALAAAFERCGDADIIVTSGGVSVGDHDLIRPALDAWGAQIRFWRVAIKPGKPLLVATRESNGRRQLVMGLPGNPASSFVTAFLFLLPLVRRSMGADDALPVRVRTTMGASLPAGGARREFLRARWDGEFVVPQSLQDSGALASLAGTNALIDRPAGGHPTSAGEPGWIYFIGNGGIA